MRQPAPPPPPVEGPKTVEEVADSARSRFEHELRARARPHRGAGASSPGETGQFEPQPLPEQVAAPEAAPPPPARDPSRPAVGTRHRAAAADQDHRAHAGRRSSARPARRPPNPIRGRFAQQQQRGGRPGGPGGRPGQGDFGRKKLPLGKKGKQTTITTPAEHKRVIRIEDSITVADLARGMGIKAPEVLKKLWGMGMTGVNINAAIDFDTAQLLSGEFGYEVQNVAFKEEDIFAQKSRRGGEAVVTRAAGRHRHGSRRPRQDVAARLDPQGARRRRRGGWHHPARRCVQGRGAGPRRHRVPRHAGPRGVHRDARPRRSGDRHRRARRRGERRRDAADASRRSRTPRTRRSRSSSRSTRSTCPTRSPSACASSSPITA